uniref:Putative lipoprotein (Modular protein) n=1 Tax=Magnetococcus massalia (strain MO-1) TaxID=451514 RepID=A0A1S7LFD2_MAGMO|nr:putative lipoprotein (modular protein) [Candidatus Magnetococcus massalia]
MAGRWGLICLQTDPAGRGTLRRSLEGTLMHHSLLGRGLGLAAVAMLLASCSPTVAVQPPDKPITINLNVKIEHEVRIKLEKDVNDLLEDSSDLF